MSTSTGLSKPVDNISAYYCLLFPNFAYYLQTLSVSIGRRPNIRSGASASSSDVRELVDIDLGPLSQVSRLHARIDYDEEQELFVLVILGRNGAWVDGVWYASGRKVPLGARTQITIANQTFHFLLPSAPDSDDSQSITSHPSSREHSVSVDIMSMSAGSAPASESGGPSDDDQEGGGSKPRVGKKRKKMSASPPKRPKGKLQSKKIPPEEMPPKPAITYANLSYRAIKSQHGRAALQDICRWIAANFEWYRLNEGSGWESSVRHTLSSNKAFTKVKRKASDRGKGFLWTVNKAYESTFENQDVAGPSTSQIRDATIPSGSSGTRKTHGATAEKQSGSTQGSLPTPATTPSRSTSVPAALPGPSPSTQQPSAATTETTTKPTAPSKPSTAVTGATLATTEAAKPASATEIPASLVIPILVKELAKDHPALLAAPPITGPAATLLSHQPIIHDKVANLLVLSPIVFGTLKQPEIKELEVLGARGALDILRERYTSFLKERLPNGSGSNRKKNKNKHKAKPPRSEGSVPRHDKLEPPKVTPTTPGTEGPVMKKRRLETDPVS